MSKRRKLQQTPDLAVYSDDGVVDNLLSTDATKALSANQGSVIQAALDLKAPLASPSLSGVPTAPTANAGTNTTQVATTAFVQTAVSGLVDTAPETLDTLNELAAALGDDPNFATTVTNSIAGKVSLTGDQTVAGVKTFSNNAAFNGDINLAAGKAVKFSATSYMTPENNVSGAEISTAGVLVVKTGSTPAERMKVDASGNVGIGTSSPSYKLDVNGTGRFQFRNSSDEIMDLAISTETFQSKSKISLNWYGNETASIKFNRGGDISGGNIELWTKPDNGVGGDIAQRVTVRSDGNVGIGTSSPTQKLSVESDAGATRIEVINNANAGGGAGIYMNTKSGGNIVSNATVRTDNVGNFQIFTGTTSDAERMRITSSGNVGIGTSSPTAPLDTAGVRIGRNFSITGRATVRLDSANTSSPSDVLFGHTAAANQVSWDGVYWSLSSRASENNNRFALFRGAGNPGGGGEAIVMIWEPNGSVLPGTNATQDLGSASLRWNTVYTSDLSLKNDHGDWTIVEGEDDLFLYNNKKNKVYKFALTEVDPSIAPAKRD